jgi:DnaJ-class molecular chaperone
LLIRLAIVVPKKLSTNEKALLEQLAKEMDTDVFKARKFRL